ncbi:T9SS type A sorting domain-containing protein [bacterium]|nr:T9SS type A sorting domain-containing protein [bacterium]
MITPISYSGHPDNNDPVPWNTIVQSTQPDWSWAEYFNYDILGDSVYVVGYSETPDSSILVKYILDGNNELAQEWLVDLVDDADWRATDIVIQVVGDDVIAYMADYSNGLQVYQVTGNTVGNVGQISAEPLDSESNILIDLYENQDVVILMNEGDEPGAIIDISDPEFPELIEAIATRRMPIGLFTSIDIIDSVVCLGHEDGLVTVSIDTLNSPDSLTTFTGVGPVNGIHAVEYDNNPHAFLACSSTEEDVARIAAVSLVIPGTPQVQMNFPDSLIESCTGVFVNQSQTYVYFTGVYSDGTSGSKFRIIDISEGITGNGPGLIGGFCESGATTRKIMVARSNANDEIAVLGLKEDCLQTIELDEDCYFTDVELDTLEESKWNWASTFVYPKLNPELPPDSVFSSIEANLGEARNDLDEYWDPSDNNSDLGYVKLNEGYRIFMDDGADWTFSGWLIHPHTRYEMWDSSPGEYNAANFMGYPILDSVDVATALSEYSGDITIVYEESGGAWIPGVYNTLGDLEPGEMYKVWTTDTLSVVINDGVAKQTTNEYWEIAEIENAPAATGDPYAILVTFDEELLSQNPYAIEIYDGNDLVGRSGIVPNQPVNLVTVWGGDENHNLEGFTNGNTFRLVVLDQNEETIFTYNSSNDQKLGVGPYIDLSFTLEDDVFGGGEGGGFEIGDGYPQPFNPKLTIPFTIPYAGIITSNVFDILGRQVWSSDSYYPTGSNKFILDVSKNNINLSSGVYIITMRYNNQQLSQKVMLLK